VHHVPRVPNQEPADLSLGVFDLRTGSPGECLYFGQSGFAGRHTGYGPYVYRMIKIESQRVVIHDFGEDGLKIIDPQPQQIPYSQGYGRVVSH
jgi:hypothetical protein